MAAVSPLDGARLGESEPRETGLTSHIVGSRKAEKRRRAFRKRWAACRRA